jgi:hypothetical protein
MAVLREDDLLDWENVIGSVVARTDVDDERVSLTGLSDVSSSVVSW